MPIHWDFWSNPDWALKDGQFVFPALFFIIFIVAKISARREKESELSDNIFYIIGAMLVVLQVHGSWVGLKGPLAPSLPRWIVPSFLTLLAAALLKGILGFTFFREASESVELKKKSPKKSKSPSSPRSLIKVLASPELAEDNSDEDYEDEEAVTPVKPARGRSPAKRAATKSPAKKTSKKTKSPSRSPRRSPRKRNL